MDAKKEEWISPDDYGVLVRADHARQASIDHFNYVIQTMVRRYRLGPKDAIEPDGRITRVVEQEAVNG